MRPAQHVLVHRVERRQRDARDPQRPAAGIGVGVAAAVVVGNLALGIRGHDGRCGQRERERRADSECDPYVEYRADNARSRPPANRRAIGSARQAWTCHSAASLVCASAGWMVANALGSTETRIDKCHTRHFATQCYEAPRMTGSVLIVDDDQSMAETLTKAMTRRGFAVTWRTSAARGAEAARGAGLRRRRHRSPHGGHERPRALRARRRQPARRAGGRGHRVRQPRDGGRRDPRRRLRLRHQAVRRRDARGSRSTRAVAAPRAARRGQAAARRSCRDARGADQIIGASPAIQKVQRARSIGVAETDATRAHHRRERHRQGAGRARASTSAAAARDGPFVAINCAAMPEALLESELFGHVKGAFTDAKRAAPGPVRAGQRRHAVPRRDRRDAARRCSPSCCARCRSARCGPSAATSEIPFDARIIAATNRDLESEVAERRFREDLFYRINVVRIDVPPLRARGSDVLLLAQHFLEQFSRQRDKKVVGLVAGGRPRSCWPTPGRATCASCRTASSARSRSPASSELTRRRSAGEDPRLPSRAISSIPGVDPNELLTIDEVERRYILRVLKQLDGNKTLAADLSASIAARCTASSSAGAPLRFPKPPSEVTGTADALGRCHADFIASFIGVRRARGWLHGKCAGRRRSARSRRGQPGRPGHRRL